MPVQNVGNAVRDDLIAEPVEQSTRRESRREPLDEGVHVARADQSAQVEKIGDPLVQVRLDVMGW